MTWTAKFTVQDVTDGPAPIGLVALATAEDIVSNTEGEITELELVMKLDLDELTLKPGDTFTASGHFTA